MDEPHSSPRATRLETLFDQAVELDPESRSDFLNRECAGDPALREEVSSLVASFDAGARSVREILAQLPLAVLPDGDEDFGQMRGPLTGSRIAQYEVGEKLGDGGMGVVYRAQDSRLGRTVALKFLPPHLGADSAAKERFVQEARAASALDHPAICPVYEIGETDDGLLFIAMPCYEGETLRERLRRGSLPVDEAVRLAMQAAQGLEKAHAVGIVHRDVKPANLFVTRGGGVKVLDFGIAKVAGVDLTQTGTKWGTIGYMSPEQLRGDAVDVRSDLWSLGVVLYEMLTGRHPFPGEHAQARIYAILNTRPESVGSVRADVPAGLQAIVERLLEKATPDRYESATALLADLHIPERAPTAGRRPLASPSGRRMRQFRFPVRNAYFGVAIVILAVLGVAGYLFADWQRTPEITSLAVLPLHNLSENPDEAYFVAGMHEALIDALARVAPLRVVSRTSTLEYQDADRSVPEIARELGVDGIVEGAVYRSGDSVHVQVRLVQALPEERHLWTQSFSRPLREAPAMHGEVARAIAQEIRVELAPGGGRQRSDARPVDVRQYEAYLRGMYLLNQSTEEEFERGLRYLHQAVALDPADPRALTGLAYGYITYGHGPAAVDEHWPIARAAVERALRLDSTRADAWAALADMKMYHEWDWKGAERAFNRALEINPSMALTRYHHAWYLTLMGRTDEALAEHDRARELDPLTPLHTVWIPGVYLWSGRFEEALESARAMVDRYPNIGTAHFLHGAAALEMGLIDEAVAAHERAVQVSEAWPWALGRTYALAGRTDDARRILEELEARPPSGWNAYGLAVLHTALGNLGEAFRWLAYEPAHAWLPWSRTDPAFAPLRTDPRFEAHLERLGLRAER